MLSRGTQPGYDHAKGEEDAPEMCTLFLWGDPCGQPVSHEARDTGLVPRSHWPPGGPSQWAHQLVCRDSCSLGEAQKGRDVCGKRSKCQVALSCVSAKNILLPRGWEHTLWWQVYWGSWAVGHGGKFTPGSGHIKDSHFVRVLQKSCHTTAGVAVV